MLPDWALDFYVWQADEPPAEMIAQYLAWVRLSADCIDRLAPGISYPELQIETERRRAHRAEVAS